MFYKTLENDPCNNFFRYGEYLTDEERELLLSIASENNEVYHSTPFGTLIELYTPKDDMHVKLEQTMVDSNDRSWNYDIHHISNVYILSTVLNFDDKYSPIEEQGYQTWYFDVSNTIKVVGVIEMDEGVATLNNGNIVSMDQSNTLYTFSSTTLCKFERDKRYLICFCLGKNFK